jgi:hypothetical protein
MPQTGWKNEHPNSLNDIPDEFLNKFVDQSYHNDAAPAFTLNISEKKCLLIVIDYQEMDSREMASENRFSLSIVNRQGHGYDLSGEIVDIYYGNDFKEFQTKILLNSPKDRVLADMISDERLWKKSHGSIDGGIYCVLCNSHGNTYSEEPIVHKELCPVLLANKIIKE